MRKTFLCEVKLLQIDKVHEKCQSFPSSAHVPDIDIVHYLCRSNFSEFVQPLIYVATYMNIRMYVRMCYRA